MNRTSLVGSIVLVACLLGLDGGESVAKTPQVVNAGTGGRGVMDDTPYYGGFGTGFLHVNADGTYGNGEIRSGELGLKFYGPSFGGPYRFQLYVRHPKGEWSGDLVADAASGVRVDYLALFPKCKYKFAHDAMPLDVKMEAFAPWTPGDSKMSSLPVLFFDFQLTNPDAAEKTVALAFMVPNPECDDGKPVIEKEGQVAGVLLQSKRAGGGTLCGMVRNDGAARVTWGADFAKGKLSDTKGNLLASSIVVPAKSRGTSCSSSPGIFRFTSPATVRSGRGRNSGIITAISTRVPMRSRGIAGSSIRRSAPVLTPGSAACGMRATCPSGCGGRFSSARHTWPITAFSSRTGRLR